MANTPKEGIEMTALLLVGKGKVVNDKKMGKIRTHYKEMEKWINEKKCNGKVLEILTQEAKSLSKGSIKEEKIEKYVARIAKTLNKDCNGCVPAYKTKKFCEDLEGNLEDMEDGITVVEVMNPSKDAKTMYLAKMVVGWNKIEDGKVSVAKVAYCQEKVIKTPGYIWAVENWKNNEEKINDWLTMQLLKLIMATHDFDIKLGIDE